MRPSRLAFLLAAGVGIVAPACKARPGRTPIQGATLIRQASAGARDEQATIPTVEPTRSPPATPRPPNLAENLTRVVEKLKLYGDMRLRHESSFDLGTQPDRHRAVLRLRLGANYRVNDRTEVGARIVTGDASDPNSPQVTLGNQFEDFEISLDRAYVLYRPASWSDSELRGGKFNHPFYRNEVYGELLWDADVQPEGALVKKTFRETPLVDTLEATLAGYLLLEQASAKDTAIIAAEIGAQKRLSSDWRSRFSLAHYGYTDVTPDGSTALLEKNRGNATVDENMDGTPDAFRSAFGIFDLNAGFTYEGAAQPLILTGEWIHNARAESAGDGWAAGVSYGQNMKQGDWQLVYQYQVIEQDAVFSSMAQDDFLLATNHRSHLAGVNYMLADGVGLFVWGLLSSYVDPGPGDEGDPWRVRIDLNVKF